MMINPYYYNLLPMREKAELLKERGELIITITTVNFDVSLYALDGQYVELYYSKTCGKVEEIMTLQDHNRLDFYTKNIDLHYLMKR